MKILSLIVTAFFIEACLGLTGCMSLAGFERTDKMDYRAAVDVRPAVSDHSKDIVSGYVFRDSNRNGIFDIDSEDGIHNIMVSNGKEVVLTDKSGRYQLPAHDNMTVFMTKPSGYSVPLDEYNVPQFFYHHLENGSSSLRFGGLPATGPLPEQINFPLIKTKKLKRFKAVVSGDTQPYSNNEVGYVRDTLSKELSEMKDIEFVMIEGDVVGDDLGLLPRFKNVMSASQIPLYLVPGNHDLDLDASDDAHSLDTFKREWGPAYYSFDIGSVHFIVFDDIEYPCTTHDFCQSGSIYNGVIDDIQMEWVKNDLSYIPEDKLIVLNMHIPLVSFLNRESVKESVDNREELYTLLIRRKVVALSGHTHTLEHLAAGEEDPNWGQTTPFNQIITGAACGSWWSGDFDDQGVPMSYQKFGAPRGYMIFEFTGNDYKEQFKAAGKPLEKQMSLSFLSPTFMNWYSNRVRGGNYSPRLPTKPCVRVRTRLLMLP